MIRSLIYRWLVQVDGLEVLPSGGSLAPQETHNTYHRFSSFSMKSTNALFAAGGIGRRFSTPRVLLGVDAVQLLIFLLWPSPAGDAGGLQITGGGVVEQDDVALCSPPMA